MYFQINNIASVLLADIKAVAIGVDEFQSSSAVFDTGSLLDFVFTFDNWVCDMHVEPIIVYSQLYVDKAVTSRLGAMFQGITYKCDENQWGNACVG